MKKKNQVFIRSTYTDLIEERTVVRDAILRIHQFPVGMEQFNAEDTEQWNTIKEYIDLSDYYILIIGKRYGTVIESGVDVGISYTEKEFNYAVSQGVPVLAFIKSDEATFKGRCFETDTEKNHKLQDFIKKVKNGRIVEWFDNSYELATKVTASLHNEIDKNNRPGWVRGSKTDIEAKIDELILMLRREFEYNDETSDDNDYDDWSEPVSDYEFKSHRHPTDGKHKEIGRNGAPIGEGEYVDGKLVKGVEYDVLVRVIQGKLTYKPNCPEDPYDASDDFDYERLEFYGWGLSFRAFGLSASNIAHDGMDQYFVADFEVAGKMEQMVNIRSLRDFLEEKDPKQLKFILDLMEIENHE